MKHQVGMALLGSLLLAISSPPGLFPGAWILMPLGLALLFEAAREVRGPRGLLALYLAGAFFLFWVSWSLRYLFFWMPLLLAPGIGGLYWVLLAWMWRRSEARMGLRFQPWFLACSWVVIEWARAEMPQVGYPQSLAVLGLYGQPWLLRPVAVLGITGQSLLIALLAAGLWALLFTRGKILIRSLPILASLLLWIGTSLWPSPLQPAGKPLRVALMQPVTPTYPGDPDYKRFRNMKPEEFLREFLPLVRSLPKVDLVAWPESFAPAMSEQRMESACQALASYLGAGQPTLFGASLREPVGEKAWLRRNVAILVDRRGRILGRHEKKRLVPLGEALPLVEQVLSKASHLALHEWIRETSGYPMLVLGRPQELMRLEEHPFSAPICYENAFASLFREDTLRGAQFFCVLSYENWYRQGSELDQLLALSVFGAIEAGRPVLRCTNDGITCHIDEHGNILEAGETRKRQALIVEVQAMTGENPALRLASWLPWFLILISALPFLSRFWKKTEA